MGIPEGSHTLWLHELPADFDRWVDLDVDGIREFLAHAGLSPSAYEAKKIDNQ